MDLKTLTEFFNTYRNKSLREVKRRYGLSYSDTRMLLKILKWKMPPAFAQFRMSEIEDRIKTLAKKGYTQAEISVKTGIPKSTVQIAFSKTGICTAQKVRRDEGIEKTSELAEQGMSESEISRIINVPISTIRYWIRTRHIYSIDRKRTDKSNAFLKSLEREAADKIKKNFNF